MQSHSQALPHVASFPDSSKCSLIPRPSKCSLIPRLQVQSRSHVASFPGSSTVAYVQYGTEQLKRRGAGEGGYLHVPSAVLLVEGSSWRRWTAAVWLEPRVWGGMASRASWREGNSKHVAAEALCHQRQNRLGSLSREAVASSLSHFL